jgi:hypothetical protein
MKVMGIGILLLFLRAIVNAQSTAEQLLSNPFESVCGKPLTDGKVYDYREGRISDITKDNVLMFQQNESNGSAKIENLMVRLAGIGLNVGGVRLNAFLKRALVGKDIVVAGNKRNASDTELIGSVWLSSLGDLNQHVLKKNLADFAEPDYEGISAFNVCVLRQIGQKQSK